MPINKTKKLEYDMSDWVIAGSYIRGTIVTNNGKVMVTQTILKRPMNPTVGSKVETREALYNLVGEK